MALLWFFPCNFLSLIWSCPATPSCQDKECRGIHFVSLDWGSVKFAAAPYCHKAHCWFWVTFPYVKVSSIRESCPEVALSRMCFLALVQVELVHFKAPSFFHSHFTDCFSSLLKRTQRSSRGKSLQTWPENLKCMILFMVLHNYFPSLHDLPPTVH